MSSASMVRDSKAAAQAGPGLLRVNRPGDVYEREAERAAEQVVSDQSGRAAWSLSRVRMGHALQRECACGGTCDGCKKEKDEQMLQRDGRGAAPAVAPTAVHSVLGGAGRPLETPTRSFMESRFGEDFSGVRIFNDSAAAGSARAVSANAYTVGNKIVFNQGKYAPESERGQRLLAHELAHVVQQRGMERPLVQRAPADGEKNDGGQDDIFAALYSAWYSSVDGYSPTVLVDYVGSLGGKYDEAQASGKMPKSKLAMASALRRIYRTLKSDEEVAERDADGALLAQEFGGRVPWSKSRPRSVSDIPGLTPERIVAWESDAAVYDLEQAQAHPHKKAKAERPAAPPGFYKIMAGGGPAGAAAAAKPTGGEANAGAGPSVEVQPQTQDEKDYAKDLGGGPVVRHGLSVLKGRTLGSLNPAEIKEEGAAKAPNQAPDAKGGEDKTPVLDACAQIWFVSNRLYLLDRSGHLQPAEESWVDVSSVRGLAAGGVYFIQPVVEKGINFRFNALEGTSNAAAAINFPHVLASLIPMLELNEKLAKQHAGVGLIIAPSFGQKQQTVSDISLDKLLRAMDRVPGQMGWAINAEINRIKENPLGEVANQALAMGMEYVSKFVPILGQAAMMMQLIELAQYLGDVGNIAAYAKTPDEIDLAAQAIARKLAQFFVFEAISRGVKSGVKLGVGAGKSLGARSSGAPEGRGVEPMARPEPKGKVEEAGGAHAKEAGAAHEERPHGMERETPNSPKEFREADAVAKAEVADDPGSTEHHKIIATKEGMGRCSDSPCPAISIVYAKDLAENPAFKARYEEIRKQGLTDIDGATEKAAGLAHDIEAARHAKASTAAAPPPVPAAVAAPPAVPAPVAAPPTVPAAAAPIVAPPAAPKIHAIDDVLSADRGSVAAADPAVRSRFTPGEAAALDRLQAAYLNYQKKAGADALGPEAWLKKQATGQPRKDAEALFGGDYGRVPKPMAVIGPNDLITLKNIPRPAAYSEPRLQADLKALQGNSGTWDRLSALRTQGVTNGETSEGLMNIMKGNIGEVLAKPVLDAQLAKVRVAEPTARLEFGTRVAQLNPDGTFDAPKLFSDGLIVSEAGGSLKLHDAFETKAGVAGGAEATTQFFEWREGRLKSGDQLVMQDGRRFTYAPGKTGAGKVRGMMTATAHIVTTKGAEHLGTGSGDQVGAGGTRNALPVTASELEYLARLMFDSLPQKTAPVAVAPPVAATAGAGAPVAVTPAAPAAATATSVPAKP